MSQMFFFPEGKSTHFQCSEAMAVLLIVVLTLSYHHDYLCFSNVHMASQ
jgi:hypothetical protein